MKWIIFCAITLLLFLAWAATWSSPSRPAGDWQAESWMQEDTSLPAQMPVRVLCLTDLPLLDPLPKPVDFVAAIQKSKQAGCNGAVLSHSWSAMESGKDSFALDDLKGSVILNEGRFLFLGIQVLNTTVKDLPKDLMKKQFDDPQVIERFNSLLNALAPLLQNRICYLSIGNESDIYLSAHPDEIKAFGVFLEKTREHARKIAPGLLVSTTLTDAGAMDPNYQKMIQKMDAHFLTYYHGQAGVEGTFKDTSITKQELLSLAARLDDRPILFQEIGFPAHDKISSAEKQAEFVTGVFDAWDELGGRVRLINYFMMYDFPQAFVKEQVSYYGVTENTEPLVRFIGSLGLHKTDGTSRPGWKVFESRGKLVR